jgi:hypothetical protein
MPVALLNMAAGVRGSSAAESHGARGLNSTRASVEPVEMALVESAGLIALEFAEGRGSPRYGGCGSNVVRALRIINKD